MNSEQRRLDDANAGNAAWRRWGPYLAERQWGTVREDYSANGDAWGFLPHDHARSRVYRWGEDGLCGISDDQQNLCLSLGLWNGRDPILKERLFGLTNNEGNHGEDVKELYYYLDATPTHSYLKTLYKYPQREFPYSQLVEENHRRWRDQSEYELLDTGLFDDDRYWDVFVEYAKASPDDVLMRVTVHNRGPEEATIHLLPQLWFRNTWSWKKNSPKPVMREINGGIVAEHAEFGTYRLSASPLINTGLQPGVESVQKENRLSGFSASPTPDTRMKPGANEINPQLLFCDNDTNLRRHGGSPDAHGFFKDALHDYLIHGKTDAVNPQRTGTKAGVHYKLTVPAGGSATIRLRLINQKITAAPISLAPGFSPVSADRDDSAASAASLSANKAAKAAVNSRASNTGLKPGANEPPNLFTDFDAVFAQCLREADEFYKALQDGITSADERHVHRQAIAGMIWSKQFYYLDVFKWVNGDPAQPPPPAERKHSRNAEWMHLNNSTVMSMPDKWEYPWYAAWDLAFHAIPLALVDPHFAKQQLLVLTREWYMHPNGQFPAYEWNFSDVNPPVHAWATWRVFQMDRKHRREKNPADKGDVEFLERVFHKLLLNFTWWVNRKDTQGRNIFQGGFLGLDNIGVFDRSAPLPMGGHINQADGTSWMAMYCVNMLRISLELAQHNRVYEDIATKFLEHFLDIAAAINGVGDGALGLWDDEDEFYYDHLNLADGQNFPMKVRSMVGLIPLFAVEVLDPELLEKLPDFNARLQWYLQHRPDLAKLVSRWQDCGEGARHLLSLLRGHRMKALLRRLLDETEFLSDYGVRALSKVHEQQPYRLDCGGKMHEVRYWPGDSQNGLFGGNSNWRGPIWMPVNFLLIEALQKFHHYCGDDFKIECPVGSGKLVTLNDAANEISRRLAKLFLKGADGQRPAMKSHAKLASDPHFRDHILFHEFFHGDDGRGLGASHQTGWTGIIAKLLHPRRASHHASDTVFMPRPPEPAAKPATSQKPKATRPGVRPSPGAATR